MPRPGPSTSRQSYQVATAVRPARSLVAFVGSGGDECRLGWQRREARRRGNRVRQQSEARRRGKEARQRSEAWRAARQQSEAWRLK
jgi:hypothetical protein